PVLVAEVHAPQAGQSMVAAQPRPCSRIDGYWTHAASGPARSGRGEAIGKVGQGLRVAGDGEGTSRSSSCSGDRSRSEGLLSAARQREPLRRALPLADGGERRDARPAPGTLHG